MAKYRTLALRLNSDEKFRALSPPPPNGQSLWVWLLTGPLTTLLPGVIPHSDVTMAGRLGWRLDRDVAAADGYPEGFERRFLHRYEEHVGGMAPPIAQGYAPGHAPGIPSDGPRAYPKEYPKSFREAFAQIEALGMAVADFGAPLVYLPNSIRYNSPKSPTNLAPWADMWADDIPECSLKCLIWNDFLAHFEERGEAFVEAFRQACPRPAEAMPGAKGGAKPGAKPGAKGGAMPGAPPRDQEQEQEQEQEEQNYLVAPCPGSDPSKPVRHVWQHFLKRRSSHYSAKNGKRPPEPDFSDARRDLIRRRLRPYRPEDLTAAIDGMFENPHNLGDNDRQKEYLDLEIALRIDGKGNNVERFRDEAAGHRSGGAPPRRAGGGTAPTGSSPESRAAALALDDQASRMNQ